MADFELAMKHLRYPAVIYTVLLLYEILKTLFLSSRAFSLETSPANSSDIFDHAAVAALCLVPVMYFMLAANEKGFSFCLPLVIIAKGLSVLSLVFLGGRVVKALLLQAQVLPSAAVMLFAAMACLLGDLVSVLFCIRRQKKVCG